MHCIDFFFLTSTCIALILASDLTIKTQGKNKQPTILLSSSFLFKTGFGDFLSMSDTIYYRYLMSRAYFVGHIFFYKISFTDDEEKET